MTQLDGNKPLFNQYLLYVSSKKSYANWIALGIFALGVASVAGVAYLASKESASG